jgi:succinyl-diaminopimelate desuccinylase
VSVAMAATVEPPPFLRQQIDRARSFLDREAIRTLLFDLASIPSPTGEEEAVARFLAGRLSAAGLEALVDPVADGQANALAWLRGRGDGPRLMIYAAIDTAFAGDPNEDEPYLGREPRADFRLPPQIADDRVVGLGAENPKAFAAAAVVAAEAIARSEIDLRGELVLALASGSMPVDGRPNLSRPQVGFGSGIRHILDHWPRPDFAVVLKPGYAVAHEEVGLAWFRVTVRGVLNYTGIRHKGPYRNPIVLASWLVGHLETWFAAYTARHTDGLVAPQGSINAIRAGSANRAAFVPATCQLDLDLRISPRSSLGEVEAELRHVLEELQSHDPEFDWELERRLALPGTATDPDNWIVRSLIRAWEDREGRPHIPMARQSGATDGAILRTYGIPTARIGLPPPARPSPYPGFSMGVADPDAVRGLAEVLVYTIVDTLGRTRTEIGLPSDAAGARQAAAASNH